MTGFDWIIVAVIVLSVAVAASQGFLYEVFSLAGVVVGYLVAAWEYPRIAAWYAPYVKSGWTANAAGFLTIFLAIVVLAGIVGRIARAGAQAAGLRWFDRVLGGAFGLVRGTLLVMVVLLAMASWTPSAGWLSRSQLAPYLLVMARGAVWVAPSEVRAQFRDGMKQIRDFQVPGKPAEASGK
jgi:membrane protein required for colicin V production